MLMVITVVAAAASRATLVASDSTGRTLNVLLQSPAGHWWSSALAQTCIGGLLAAGGGFAAPLVQRWMERRRLKGLLVRELEELERELTGLLASVETSEKRSVDSAEALFSAQQIRAARDGFDRSRDSLVQHLDPVIRSRVVSWYESLRKMTEKVEMLAAQAERSEEDVMARANLAMTRYGVGRLRLVCGELLKLLKRA